MSDYTQKTSTTNNSGAIPVVNDNTNIDSGLGSRAQQDSDEQLVKDDRDAIDESNIIDSKTRGAQPTGSYSEGKDEGDLPKSVADGDDGRSAVAQ